LPDGPCGIFPRFGENLIILAFDKPVLLNPALYPCGKITPDLQHRMKLTGVYPFLSVPARYTARVLGRNRRGVLRGKTPEVVAAMRQSFNLRAW
jgi:hypothetical protein